MKSLGHHILIDLHTCPAGALDKVEVVRRVMDHAAEAAGWHVVQSSYHQFEPHGVSGATIIQESHLTIHTWPEYGYAAVDLFYCGEHSGVDVIIESIFDGFFSGRAEIKEIARGVIDGSRNLDTVVVREITRG